MRRNTKKAKFFIALVEKYQMSPFYSFEILKEIYLYKVTDREVYMEAYGKRYDWISSSHGIITIGGLFFMEDFIFELAIGLVFYFNQNGKEAVNKKEE